MVYWVVKYTVSNSAVYVCKVFKLFHLNRIGTFTIVIFSLTFGADVGGLYLCEVREQCEVRKQQNCDDDISAGHEKKIEP